MGFVVSSLTDYIDQSSKELLGRSFFENRSAEYFGGLQTGIKTVAALQLLAVSATAQADACGFTASGSTTFSQRELTVGALKYQDTLCMKDLKAKWTQTLLKQGSNAENESVSFESEIADLLISLVKEEIEAADWQGNGIYTGLIATIDAAGTAVSGNTGAVTVATDFTATNAIAIINAMCDAAPAKIKTKSDKVLFIGTDWFDIYVNALMNANLFNFDATAWADYTLVIPGKNVKLVGVHGLDAEDRMFLGRMPNFVVGTDMENEEEQFKLWYDENADLIRYSIKFKRGLQVAYPNELVQFTLVP
jgi:hypothetical protein